MHIVFDFKPSPAGGGYQFLSALRAEMRRQHLYQETANGAKSILLNANPASLPTILNIAPRLKQRWPATPLLLRLDGPISLIRGRGAHIDRLISSLAELFFDGIIFQSNWCQKNNQLRFNTRAPREAIIYNAVDTTLFYPRKKLFNKNERTKVLAVSWSNNRRKGFAAYSYLDQTLDFTRYSMTFIGNTPIAFKNIRTLSPLSSTALARELRQHDIYVTASENDPCSNSLLEAMASGLPAVALDSGGHPELIQTGGELFTTAPEMLRKIELVRTNYHSYVDLIPQIDIATCAQQYSHFGQKIRDEVSRQGHHLKKISRSNRIQLAWIRARYQFENILLA